MQKMRRSDISLESQQSLFMELGLLEIENYHPSLLSNDTVFLTKINLTGSIVGINASNRIANFSKIVIFI